MLRTLLCLFPTETQYPSVILLNMLVLEYQRRTNTPAWLMFLHNFSLFNEESGEMSFSALARAMLGHTNRSDFAHVNTIYILLHQYVCVDDDVQKDRNTKALRNGYQKVDVEGRGVQAARVFLLGHLQTIERNQYRIYSGKPVKGNPAFNNQRAGIASLCVATELKPMWIPDIRKVLGKKFATLKKKLGTNYGYEVAHIFPEFSKYDKRPFQRHAAVLAEQKGGPVVELSSSDESSSSEEQDCDEPVCDESEVDSDDIGEMKGPEEEDGATVPDVASVCVSLTSNSQIRHQYPELYSQAMEAGMEAAIALSLRDKLQDSHSSDDEGVLGHGSKRPRSENDSD